MHAPQKTVEYSTGEDPLPYPSSLLSLNHLDLVALIGVVVDFKVIHMCVVRFSH